MKSIDKKTRHVNGDVLFGADTGAVGVDPGVTAALACTCTRRCYPRTLFIKKSTAENFLLSAINVGNQSLIDSSCNLDLAVFLEKNEIKLRPVLLELGVDFVIEITNISKTNARFNATVVADPAVCDCCDAPAVKHLELCLDCFQKKRTPAST